MNVKQIIKEILVIFHLDVTKNMYFDRLTNEIMKQNIKKASNCIDVGCHKGEMLVEILKLAPKGTHFAFEPIPAMYKNLDRQFGAKAKIFAYALSDKCGKTTFQHVKNAPAYSGIKKRRYDIAKPEIEEIEVEISTLDTIIPTEIKIDFIKIDVEGAELGVLQGAIQLLKRDLPVVLFEFGLGASDFYGTKPDDIYRLLVTDCNLKIFTLKGFLRKQNPLSLAQLTSLFLENKEYYFVAAK